MRMPCAHYGATGGTLLPSIPYTPPPGPGYVPPAVPSTPGAAGEEWRVAVGGFPNGRPVDGPQGAVVLWDAVVRPVIRDRRSGPNEVDITCPASPRNMRILGLPISGETYTGTQLYTPKNGLSWEFLVGSTADGLVKYRFVVRDQITVSAGTVSVRAVGWVGGLTADRIIGAPERLNMLAPATENDTSTGWVIHGFGTATGVESGGPSSDAVRWVTGTPDRLHYIEKSVPYTLTPAPWGRQRVAGLALVKLPGPGLDIDDYGLVTVAVFREDGTQYWPRDNGAGPDMQAGIVTSDMARGSWMSDPVIGFGFLPPPPASGSETVTIRLRLHPVDEAAKTYYDAREIVRRENTSTVSAVDLTKHPFRLFDHFQRGRDKTPVASQSAWKITVLSGDPVGISEVGTWWHEDGQQGDDALEAIAGRGVDIYDLPGPGRVVMAEARRGFDRPDMIVHDWDVCGEPEWRLDLGAIRTAIRATSSASSVWGGSDEGYINRTAAGGQVIDASVSGPTGMTPSQLRGWARQQGITLSTIPLTCTLPLRWTTGLRLGVGDSVRVAIRSNAAGEKDWMRVTEIAPDPSRRTVAVTFGLDPDHL